MTKKQMRELYTILSNLESGRKYLMSDEVAFALRRRRATTTLDYVRESDGAVLFELNREIGSPLAQLHTGIGQLRNFIKMAEQGGRPKPVVEEEQSSSGGPEQDEIIEGSAREGQLYTAEDVIAVNLYARKWRMSDTNSGMQLDEHEAAIVQRGQALMKAGARMKLANDEGGEYDSPRLRTYDAGIIALYKCSWCS